MGKGCFECPNRSIGCHGRCADYKKRRAQRDKELEEAHKDTEMETYLSSRVKKARRNNVLRYEKTGRKQY